MGIIDYLKKKSNYLSDEYVEKYNLRKKYTNLYSLKSQKFVDFNSSYLKKMFKDITSKDSSYVTCIDKYLENNKNYRPGYVSAFLKSNRIHSDCNVEFEILASKISNLFGIPTVYNDEYIDNDLKKWLLSIDCVPDNQTMLSVSDILGHNDGFQYFDHWKKTFQDMFLTNKQNDFNIDYKQFMSDFVKQYLFRRHIVHDVDYDFGNCSIIIDENKNGRLAPNYDMEYSFDIRSEGTMLNYELPYLMENYPNEVQQVKDKFDELIENGYLNKIIHKTVSNSNVRSLVKEVITNAHDNFNMAYEKSKSTIVNEKF